jgi:sialate O-acetylesterase
MVKLKPMKENANPQKLIISGNNTLTFQNILIGEVWLCSGQSNMERQLGMRPPQKPILNWQAEAKDAANYPQIRQFAASRNPSENMVEDANGKWTVCDSITVKSFTAVGFFFARALTQKLNVPIGLLFSAVGGTPAEKWTSRACLEATPGLKDIVDNYEKSILKFPEAIKKFKLNEDSLLASWKRDTTAARIANKPLPRKPAAPVLPAKSGDCGGLFNGMISPLIPYAIKGVIWYQGEGNSNRAKQYQTLFPAMIGDWRKQWNLGNFPFLFVQIAPNQSMKPEIREAQLISWKKTPNTAMVVTVDYGDSADIHPVNKKPVGERLALAARALAYNQKVAYASPIYSSMEVKNNTIILSFDFADKGLVVKGDALTDFVISEDGKVFLPADATISGNKVIVSAKGISKPVAVRMGWSNVPHINLFNKEGLPASPFRTDVQ